MVIKPRVAGLLGLVVIGLFLVLSGHHRRTGMDWEQLAADALRQAEFSRRAATRAEEALAASQKTVEELRVQLDNTSKATPGATTSLMSPFGVPFEPSMVRALGMEADASDVLDEGNLVPEDARADDERSFSHFIQPLPELPADCPEEVRALRRAFVEYTRNRDLKTNIPVYATACVGVADCPIVKEQFKSLDVGVGHVIVVLNHPNGDFRKYFAEIAAYHPGRFTLIYREEGGGCADSWNIMLRLGFSITPTPQFVMATNGDLFALPGYLGRFATFMRDSYNAHVAGLFVEFSSFAVNLKGWQQLGPFDEVVFPAYAEDVEYRLRAASLGVTFGHFPGTELDVSHRHAGSRSTTVVPFLIMCDRWDRNDYIYRKWNVDMTKVTDFANSHPYRYPWNQPALTHRRSWVLDPDHRRCIRTGEGVRHQANQERCTFSLCASCYYNATVLQPLLPPGQTLSPSALSIFRQRL